MLLFKQKNFFRIGFILTLSSLLAACLGNSKEEIIRYYLIDPSVTTSLTETTDQKLNIELRDLEIPQYLQRFQIVTRSAENRLRLAEFNQWGENLRENLIRTMARNLSSALASPNIITPLNRGTSLADYRIHIHIEQFEHDIDNKVKLSARWELIDGTETRPLGIHDYNNESPTEIMADDYDAIVSSMQALFADLSLTVAKSILKQK